MKLASLLVLLASALPLQAGTLYTTFGPGQSFGSGGYTVEDNLGWAAPFQTSVSAAVASIDVALALQAGSMSVEVVIAGDSSGAPGAAIETFTINNLPATPTVETANSTLHPLLSAGTPYWFEVIGVGSNPGTDIGQLYGNNQGLTETVDITSNGGATWSVFSAGEPNPAFDVNSTVPEPATFPIVATILTGISLQRRCKRTKEVAETFKVQRRRRPRISAVWPLPQR